MYDYQGWHNRGRKDSKFLPYESPVPFAMSPSRVIATVLCSWFYVARSRARIVVDLVVDDSHSLGYVMYECERSPCGAKPRVLNKRRGPVCRGDKTLCG